MHHAKTLGYVFFPFEPLERPHTLLCCSWILARWQIRCELEKRIFAEVEKRCVGFRPKHLPFLFIWG
jgi:hypothetical protein